MIKILIVEDDASIHQLLIDLLKGSGHYQLTSAYSGTEALLRLAHEEYDLLLLDLMLPGVSGEEVLRQTRNQHQGGVIVLSAKDALSDKVSLLELGADDYLTKPFHKEELLARIKSVLRRYQKDLTEETLESEASDCLSYRELSLKLEAYEAYFSDEPLHLTQTEFHLLATMIAEPEKVFTRDQLYFALWGEEAFVEDNAINMHISNLRKKIAQFAGNSKYIETVWGIGFKLSE